MASKTLDRFLTILAVLSVPVLCASLWRMGGSAVDKYHDLADRRAMGGLLDSVVAAGENRVVFSGSAVQATYVEVVDYQCPFCRRVDSLMHAKDFLAQNIRIIAVQLPLTSIHPLAERAAVAAVCSSHQGAFASFHHNLYSRGIPVQADSMWRLAASSGARDSAAFVQCLDSPAAREEVKRETKIAARLKVIGTPTFVDARGNQVPFEQIARLGTDDRK
jgi:protein-disulfide isomerase